MSFQNKMAQVTLQTSHITNKSVTNKVIIAQMKAIIIMNDNF